MTGDYKTAEAILRVTTRMYHVTTAQLKSRNRTNHLSWARHMAFYALYEMTEFSYPDISRMFDRDHSSVMFGYNKVAKAAQNGKAEEVARYMRACRYLVEEGMPMDSITPASMFDSAIKAF